MPTRRALLRNALASPFLTCGSFRERAQQPSILAEPHLLSEESAGHFQALLNDCKLKPRNLCILPAAQQLTAQRAHDLQIRAGMGTWLILESGLCFASQAIRREQIRIWAVGFGLRFSAFRPTTDLYAEYAWPIERLVRTFDVCTPLRPSSGEIIGQCGSVPAACVRRIGLGGIIFLGSMLGPGLAAGEPEAREVGLAIIESIARF
jgi:hypothetical protein